MDSFGSIAWSSVGKKVITALTGFALVGFVIVHLLGNFTLFIGPGAFNGYAHFLETAVHGWLIYAFEAFLIVVFLFHMISAITVAWTDKRKARDKGYKFAKNAGGKSKKTLSSVSMIYTGILLIVFVVAHIFLFKFNGGHPHETNAEGVKNLYKAVVSVYKQPGFTIFTVVVMILLGLHLRHGVWSAFQSMGWANDKYLPVLTRIAAVAAVLLAIGFIIIPVILFLSGDPNAVAGPGGH
jgi:succinate dehydrogenase / fumarate reductase cytochrome b subunit